MPTFGQHETAQRLFLSGVGGLYALASDPKKVVKVLQPPEGIWADDQVREEIDGFLLRGKTQRAIAKNSQHWAPVHEVAGIRAGTEGSSGGGEAVSYGGEYRAVGAYEVLDRYERSAQSLIDGRVNLLNSDLRNVMSGVIQGLIDAEKSAKRPHGNLKPSNILLGASADLAAAKVHLTDPAADGALGANARTKDIADAAKILYELVNLRRYEGGTIGRSREWDKLGPNGEDWRKLCNALLDPNAPADERNFEKILPKIATWTAKPKQSKKPVIIAASVFLLLAAGGGSAWYFTRPPKLAFDEPAWEKLCLNYYGWFDNFVDHFSDEATRRKYGSAPYPTDVIKILSENAKDIDRYTPKAIASKPASAADLAAAPTDDAKTGYGPYYTKKGDELIDSIAASLTPEHWPLLKTLDDTAKTYDDRGWKKPAAAIRGLIRSARPPAMPDKPLDIGERIKLVNPADVFGSVDNTIQAATSVRTIDQSWNRIVDQLKRLPPAGEEVPLLRALPDFATKLPQSEVDPGKPPTLDDVKALSTSFEKVDKIISEIIAGLSPRQGREVVFAELAKDPKAQVAPSIENFNELALIAPGYLKLADDPRTKTNWVQALSTIQNDEISIIEKYNSKDANLPTLKQQYAALAKKVADWQGIVPIEKNSAQLKSVVSEADALLGPLARFGGDSLAPYLKKPNEFIAEQQARITGTPLAKATPIVYQSWRRAQEDLIKKLQDFSKGLTYLPYEKYQEFSTKFATLETIYATMDTQVLPARVKDLSDILAAQGAGTPSWQQVIAQRIAVDEREIVLKELLTNPVLKWVNDLPVIDDPGYVSYQQQRLAAYEALCADAVAFITDCKGLIDRLNHLQLLPAEALAGAASWRNLYAKWFPEKHVLLKDAAIAAAVKPINDRTAAVLALDSVNDYKTLVADAQSTAPEIALTAWRKLGSAPVSEELPVLDDEEKAQAALATALNDNKDLTPAQRTAFTGEIAAQRPVRWHRWADTLSSAAAIQAALDRMATFNVTLSAQTDTAMIYNRDLYALRKEFEKGLKEAELKPIAQNFINAVNAMPAAVSNDQAIKDLLARLAKPLQQSEQESSSAGAGPKLAGWEQETPANRSDIRLYYSPNKANARHTLEFVRMQVNESTGGPAPAPNQQGAPAGQKTIFLCTTEMSLGLFADTVSGKFTDLDNTGKTSKQAHYFKVPARAADDIWSDLGPRGWKITDKKFVLNPTWLSETNALIQPGSYYPENAKPMPPAANDPMQLLSPWSAMYVARLLGCRLPTSDEWQTAYNRFEVPAGNNALPKDAWNLRGDAPASAARPSWRSQQEYADKMTANGMKYPDQGAFLTTDLLFASINAEHAKPWTADALAKLAPGRITPGPSAYQGSTLWFRKVGSQPGAGPPGSGTMQELVGNVAEYAFDGPNSVSVIKDNAPTVAAIDASVLAAKKTLFVIGGSSLSPPEIQFNKKQELDPDLPQTALGYCDVGFRLAYTAPIDSIVDVLAATFKDPKYLPGSKVR